MYFSLDDIDELVISGRSRLDNSGEYDISYYENYVNENSKIILELMKDYYKQLDLIKDKKTKDRILETEKYLLKVYKINKKKEPKKEYEESKYNSPNNAYAGYLGIHKYAAFIEKDLTNLAVESCSNLINFMNRMYEYYKFLEMKGLKDNVTLYQMFSVAKNACSKFGIHSPDPLTIYESFTEDPYDTKQQFLSLEVRVDEENSMKENILFSSIPYTVTLPVFSYQGPSKQEIPVKDRTPQVLYNKSYILNLENSNDGLDHPDSPKLR